MIRIAHFVFENVLIKEYGIQAKNAEQTFAIHAILQQDVRLVSLTGVAGTGKTLIALASVLDQRKNFSQIYLSFLPYFVIKGDHCCCSKSPM